MQNSAKALEKATRKKKAPKVSQKRKDEHGDAEQDQSESPGQKKSQDNQHPRECRGSTALGASNRLHCKHANA